MGALSMSATLAISVMLSSLATLSATAAGDPSQGTAEFQSLITRLNSPTGDDCEPNVKDIHAPEDLVLRRAASIALASMNAAPAVPAQDADTVMQELEKATSQVDGKWSQERRLHYRILDLKTAIILELSIRSRVSYFVYAVPEYIAGFPRRKNSSWRLIDQYPWPWRTQSVTEENLALYPLARGPNGNPRFLAVFEQSSCGDGQTGIDYTAYEWDQGSGVLVTLLRRTGVLSGQGMFDEVRGSKKESITVPDIGILQVSGLLITLPYCWHSAVDTYVWATLCSVDTYDLSHDQIRFVGRRTNRPDLETVARAIEYAQAKDDRALGAYVAGPDIADMMMQAIPGDFALAPSVTVDGIAADKEKIDMGDFSVEIGNVQGRWVITAFASN